MPMTPTLPKRGLLLGLAFLLSACQTFIDGDKQLYEQSGKLLDESLQQAQSSAKVTPPPAVQAALLPPLSTSVFAGGPRFDVAAKDMPARDFFLSLMDSAGQNLVVHPAVSGNITFSLRRVTIEEVLAAVRDSYGYDFRRTSYGYQILPNEKVTRSYDLNYLNLQRLGESDTRVSSGQVESSETDTSSDSSGSTSSDRSVTTLNASKVITSSNVDFWKEIEGVVRAVVGGEEGNSVVVNPQASLLVVRASSADQENVARFLEQAQRNLQRQVVLETKILEVQLKDGFQAGISWSQIGSEVGGVLDGENLTGPDGIGGVFSGILNLGDFTGLIQLLQTQGEVRVLSSPRISTLNNQKAVIKVGTDEFFVTDVSSNSSTSTVAGVTQPTQDVTLTPFFSGISLDVTPADRPERRGDPARAPHREPRAGPEQDHRARRGQRVQPAAGAVHLAPVRLHRARAQRPGGGDRRPAAEQQRKHRLRSALGQHPAHRRQPVQAAAQGDAEERAGHPHAPPGGQRRGVAG